MRKRRKIPIILFSALAILMLLYILFVFSNNSIIKKWRYIYIETAMTTLNHQWLAEWFIPHSVIDNVMNDAMEQQVAQKDIESSWQGVPKPAKVSSNSKDNPSINTQPIVVQNEPDFIGELQNEEPSFFEKYWELDGESFTNWLKEHPDIFNGDYNDILIEDYNFTYGLTTVFGERIKILDTKNNFMIVEVKGQDYRGLLAITKNPEQVSLVNATTLGVKGELVKEFSENNHAICVINASGFADENWMGNGGYVTGSSIINGIEYGHPTEHLKLFGFKGDYHLYIENYSEDKVPEYIWGAQFSPALIVDGEIYVQGTFGYGIQPRSAIGQSSDGDFLMLIIDGRQVGHSLGATVTDLAEIMLRHKAYQAMNLDGGSSSIMTYKNETISRPSSTNNLGRYLPNAFIVKYMEDLS